MNKDKKLSDYLPSIVVKDLKQLINNKFVWISLVLLWMLCGLGAVTSLAAPVVSDNHYMVRETYEWIISPILLLVCLGLPFLGYISIRQDFKKSCIDFIVLTGQSSWKIVFCKWLSTMIQIILVTFAFSIWVFLLMRSSELTFASFAQMLGIIWVVAGISTSVFMFLPLLPFIFQIFVLIYISTTFLSILCMKLVYSGSSTFDGLIDTSLMSGSIYVGSCYAICLICLISTVVLLFLFCAERIYGTKSQLQDLKLRLLPILPIIAIFSTQCVLLGDSAAQDLWFKSAKSTLVELQAICFWFVYLCSVFSLAMSETVHYTQYMPGIKKHLPGIPKFLQVSGWFPSALWSLMWLCVACLLVSRGYNEEMNYLPYGESLSYCLVSLLVMVYLPLSILNLFKFAKLGTKLSTYGLIIFLCILSDLFFNIKWLSNSISYGANVLSYLPGNNDKINFLYQDRSFYVPLCWILLGLLAWESYHWLKINRQCQQKARRSAELEEQRQNGE